MELFYGFWFHLFLVISYFYFLTPFSFCGAFLYLILSYKSTFSSWKLINLNLFWNQFIY